MPRKHIKKVKWICPECGTVKMLRPKVAKVRKFCSKQCKDSAGQTKSTKTAIANTLKLGYTSGRIKSSRGMQNQKHTKCSKTKIKNSLQQYYGTDLQTMSYKRFRRYIFKTRGHKCEKCNWHVAREDGLIPVELHCIDGNHNNRADTNFVILCPNHHSLTKNYMFYGGKRNKK